MSFEETIILSLRREYQKDEKFRFLLKHLDNVENELRDERKKHTEVIKKCVELQAEVEPLKEKIKELEKMIETYQKDPDNFPIRFIKVKTYEKMRKKKEQVEKRMYELVWELKELKEKLNTK